MWKTEDSAFLLVCYTELWCIIGIRLTRRSLKESTHLSQPSWSHYILYNVPLDPTQIKVSLHLFDARFN